jgi:hypothetical protein
VAAPGDAGRVGGVQAGAWAIVISGEGNRMRCPGALAAPKATSEHSQPPARIFKGLVGASGIGSPPAGTGFARPRSIATGPAAGGGLILARGSEVKIGSESNAVERCASDARPVSRALNFTVRFQTAVCQRAASGAPTACTRGEAEPPRPCGPRQEPGTEELPTPCSPVAGRFCAISARLQAGGESIVSEQ